MVYFCLGIYILLVATFALFFIKREYLVRFNSIFRVLGLLTLIYPAIESLMSGISLESPMFRIILLEITPLSAIFILLMVFILVLSDIRDFVSKNNQCKDLTSFVISNLFLVITLLLIASSLSLHFCLLLCFSSVLTYFIVKKEPDYFSNFLSDKVYLLSSISDVILFFMFSLMSVAVHSVKFNELWRAAINLPKVNCVIFMALLIAIVLRSFILLNFKKYQSNSPLRILFQVLPFINFYIMLLIVKLRLFPNATLNNILAIFFAIGIILLCYKQIHTKNIKERVFNNKLINYLFVFFSFFIMLSGLIYDAPVVVILGLFPVALFMLNYILLAEYYNGIGVFLPQNNDDKKGFLLSLGLIIGSLFVLSPAGFGCISLVGKSLLEYVLIMKNISPVYSVSVLVFLIIVAILNITFVAKILKTEFLGKTKGHLEEVMSQDNKLILIAPSVLILFILLSSIFVNYTYKMLTVPVSYLVGGQAFKEIFVQIQSLINLLSNFLLIFVVLVVLYVIVKFLLNSILKMYEFRKK